MENGKRDPENDGDDDALDVIVQDCLLQSQKTEEESTSLKESKQEGPEEISSLDTKESEQNAASEQKKEQKEEQKGKQEQDLAERCTGTVLGPMALRWVATAWQGVPCE
ncbi:unnamed protein product [Sphagnum tenellum]